MTRLLSGPTLKGLCVCVCVRARASLGLQRKSNMIPVRFRGPHTGVSQRSGSEIQDGQLEKERGGRSVKASFF